MSFANLSSSNNNSDKYKAKKKIKNISTDVEKDEITPTFIIKYLNLEEIKKDYLEGNYTDIVPSKSKLKRKELCNIFVSKLPLDEFEQHSYKFTNQNGKDVIIKSNGFIALDNYLKGNRNYRPLASCRWCHHLPEDKKEMEGFIGIPVEYFVTEQNEHIFWTIINFCTFNCALRFLQEELKKGSGGYYKEIYLTYLLALFDLCFPGQELNPADDVEMLISHDGFLERKDYFTKGYKYVRKAKIFIVPAKIEYRESN